MGERQFALPFFIYRREKEMHSFVDAKGRTWNIKITIGSAKAYMHNVDIIDGAPSYIVEKLASSLIVRLDMLWHFIENKNQADRDDFENALEGKCLHQADEALWSELNFFIQSTRPEMTEVMEKLLAKYKQIRDQQVQLILQVADQLNLDKASETLAQEAQEIIEESQQVTLKKFIEQQGGLG
jgi:hypothetical protein